MKMIFCLGRPVKIRMKMIYVWNSLKKMKIIYLGHPLNRRMKIKYVWDTLKKKRLKIIYIWDTLYKKGWKMLETLFIRKLEGYIFWTPCKKRMTIIYIWDTIWKEGWRIIYILLGFIKYPGFYLIKGRILNLSTKSENRKLLFAQKFSHGNCYERLF